MNECCQHIIDAHFIDCETGTVMPLVNGSITGQITLNAHGWVNITIDESNYLIEQGLYKEGLRFFVDYRCQKNDDPVRIFDGFITGRTNFPTYDTESHEVRSIQSWYGHDNSIVVGNGIIAFDEGSPGAFKSGPADQIICEYMNENVGQNFASMSRGGAQYGNPTYGCQKVTVDGACGTDGANNWEGDRSNRQVGETVFDIGDAYNVDIRFSTVGATCDVTVQTFHPFSGVDRTIATGQSPIIITEKSLTAKLEQTIQSSSVEAFVAIVEGDNETLEVVSSRQAARPCRIMREIYVDGSGQTTTESLLALGNEAINKARRNLRSDFNFDTCGIEFVRDIFLGDIMTSSQLDDAREFKVIHYAFNYTGDNGFEWTNVQLEDFVR